MLLGIRENEIVAAQIHGIIPDMDEIREVDTFSFEWVGFSVDEFDWSDPRNPIPSDVVKEREAELNIVHEKYLKKEKENKIREHRNALLTESDWTQVSDAPVDQEAWAIYRQALRDVPQQEGFPENIIWPEKPE